MAFVFERKLAIPQSAVASSAVAFTAPSSTISSLMPPTALFAAAAVGIAALVFSMSAAMPWSRASRAIARVRPSGQRDHASPAGAAAAGTCLRVPEAPNRREADDALDLVRLEDDGGWQITGRA